MSLEIKVINPLNLSDYDKLILSNHDCCFFHSSSWAKVLNEAYKYRPLYFSIFVNNKLAGLIPLMEIRSILTGKKAVALPFTDYCDPIISNDIYFEIMLDHIIKYGRQAGWKYFELRSGKTFLNNQPNYSTYYIHTLNLAPNEDEIYTNFRDSTKRNVQKSEGSGVKVQIHNSLKSLHEFYRLNCITRRFHGLPPQPFHFFKKVHRHVFSKNLGFVVLATWKNKSIAGAIFFHFGNTAIFKYGACDRAFQHLRPNNIVMWEAIKRYHRDGYKFFCFGRTAIENIGLRQFKTGWRPNESIIKYYRFDIKSGASINGNSKSLRNGNGFFHSLPIPLLRLIGSISYRHIG